MTRCFACSSNVRLPGGDGTIRTWSSFDELQHSADSGCDFCTLCRQYLSNWVNRKTLCDTPCQVRLYGYEDHFTLECAAFQGALNMPVEDPDNEPQGIPVFSVNDNLLEVSVEWLRRCLSTHEQCEDALSLSQRTGSHAASNLPRRLIDLTHTESVVIIDCRDWLDNFLVSPTDLQDYCTLSYRWGETSHDYVLMSSFEMLLEMPLASMPQTFHDAFAVVRALGVRFLWIDALCIVQPSTGDDSDWLSEGPRMGTIYQNSIVTIAATCALHAHEGFLENAGSSVVEARPCLTTMSITQEDGTLATKNVQVKGSTPDFFHCVSNSALNKRGWVTQERALSKRIMHFTEHGIFWECGTTKAHHIYGDLGRQLDLGRCRQRESMMSVARSRRTRHLCPVEWFHFVKHYSLAKFSNPRDRLMALSSIARAVQPIIQAEYLAGLWKNDLVRGLQWHCFRPETRPRCFNAPTWSWASVGSGVDFTCLGLHTFPSQVAEVLDIDIRPSPGFDHYGEISTGKLKIRATLDHRKLPKIASERYDARLRIYWDVTQLEAVEQDGWQDYTTLPVCGRHDSIRTAGFGKMFGAMILEPVGETKVNERGITESLSREFRRIGWVEYDCPDTGLYSVVYGVHGAKYFEFWKSLDPTEVTIV